MNRNSILPLRLNRVGLEIAGSRILHDINLHFTGSEISVILGANGAGKSMLLKICHGLLQPTEGDLQWRISNSEAIRAGQAMVLQRPVLLRRSVQKNIEYAASKRRIKIEDSRLQEILLRTGLTGLEKRHAHALSVGEQQRLAIARAWILNPEIFFLDEPTAHLDPHATQQIETILHEIQANGVKIVMTTHSLQQASNLANEILFIEDGSILETTPSQDFFRSPASRQGRRFLAGQFPKRDDI